MSGGAVLAIDPGCTHSAYVVIDPDLRPVHFGQLENLELRLSLPRIARNVDTSAIETVASYGMAVGAEVFETCIWIGRFYEVCLRSFSVAADLVYRRDVKLHHCGSARAKDANITQALVDRFAKGQPNYGKGTKSAPGWFYGFKADVWQAYALAVYVADTGGVSEHEAPT